GQGVGRGGRKLGSALRRAVAEANAAQCENQDRTTDHHRDVLKVSEELDRSTSRSMRSGLTPRGSARPGPIDAPAAHAAVPVRVRNASGLAAVVVSASS